MSQTPNNHPSNTDELLQQLLPILAEQNESSGRIVSTLREQNEAISQQPSRHLLLNVQLLATLFLAATLVFSTFIIVRGQQESRAVGDQNQATVDTFCSADNTLPECTTPGSPTTKAAAILATCRIFDNLVAVSPVEGTRPAIPSSAGCNALGFPVRAAAMEAAK